jgi:heptaprenyl diphosphate synthase
MTDRLVKLSRLAMLLALATVIHTAEQLLPITVVWFRFGFANIISLVTLELYGFRAALLVTLGRVFLGSLLSGLFGSPAFLLALSGGTCAIAVMGLVWRINGGFLSEVGISVCGAVTHNCVQLGVAYLVLIRSEGVLLLLPLMLVAAGVTGLLNGLAARFLLRRLRMMQAAVT